LENKLKEYISGGNDKSGKLSRYVKQVAIQGADAYTSILDQKITDKYYDKITGYIVTGSLIETSSPQCKYCVKDLNRLITKDDFEEIKKRSVGLIDGTTFKNLPTLKLHFGCRHTFTPKLT
jgi:protein-disulfide isomerase